MTSSTERKNSMNSASTRLMAGMLLIALTAPAMASGLNMRWLQYSPVSYFTDEDWRLARAAAKEALNEAELGKAVTWENTESGAQGSSTPLKAIKKDGMPCRYLKIYNNANETSGESVHLFCKIADGSWKAAPR